MTVSFGGEVACDMIPAAALHLAIGQALRHAHTMTGCWFVPTDATELSSWAIGQNELVSAVLGGVMFSRAMFGS
jgi:hypothetical protein